MAAAYPRAGNGSWSTSTSPGVDTGDARLQGTILSYSAEKAWGFVTAPGLEVVIGAGKGIFFHIKDFISSISTPFPVAGLPITFDYTTDARGKPRACRVLPVGESLPPASMAAPPQPPRHHPAVVQPPSSTAVLPARPAAVRQVTFVAPPARPTPSPPPAAAPSRLHPPLPPPSSSEDDRLEGHILTYNEEKAWGFITAPGLESVIGESKGIFFHIKDFAGGGTLPKSGTPVTFEYSVDQTGKPHARQVRPTGVLPPLFTASANLSPSEIQAAGMSEKNAEPPMPKAERFDGAIQTFSEEKAWGFISAPGLEPLLGAGKGIFFHIKDCVGTLGDGTPRSGYPVSFSIQTDQNGKLHATNVTPQESAFSTTPHVEPTVDKSAAFAANLGVIDNLFGDPAAAKRARLA